MRSSRVARYAYAVCAAIAMFPGCSGSQMPINPSGASQSVAQPGVNPPSPQSLRSQPALSHYASHRVRRNVQTEAVLYNFTGGSDGAYPQAGLTNLGGTLYGTTTFGGASNLGAVSTIAPSGTETVLYSFTGGSDGAYPQAGLTNLGGTLYGTTSSGGASNIGTVFTITTSGTETVLYSFAGGTDGAYPSAGLTNVGGALYGTTTHGGASGKGTVFKITTSGTETVLYSFAGGTDGAYPYAGLTSENDKLYGTTLGDGGTGCSCGTIFRITTSGAYSQLYSFAGGTDGAGPEASLTNVSGKLYGTTAIGGGSGCSGSGCGTVFKITTSGTEKVLYRFAGGKDGASPQAGLTSVNGTLYGTTNSGGTNDTGTIFAVLAHSGPEIVLYSFAGGTDGAYPLGGLTNVNGTLYGTTNGGGTSNVGTVFSLSF
ncbi:MAG TPA: choice-of-anchor tandem repeat GloVer-containing protein [Candidatus Cybelea sp.]|nr:choice-of-anchor tandem repeat GloVer-containing protein [Candidatus Cybelea sp.]